jgi:hypothetical protein
MIDALLYAARDAVRGGGLGYDRTTCTIMADGRPPPRCGEVFVAVHQHGQMGDMMNALDEYYGWDVTLTMRVTIPLDRVGEQLLSKNLAADVARKIGFNYRAQQLKTLLHMNWFLLQDANNNLVELYPQAPVVYGFAEPAQFVNMDDPDFVGGAWFSAKVDSDDIGLMAALHFDRARRLQPIANYV